MPQPVDLGGGRWRIRVFLGRDPINGRQQTRTFTFEAKGVRAARVRAGELERQAQASPGARESFGQAVETWWGQWLKKNRSPTTVREYRRIIDRRLVPLALWGRPVDRLSVNDFDKLYDHLEADGLSPASIRRVHAIVVQVGKDMSRRGLTAGNVAKEASLPEGGEREMRIPTDDELAAIFLAAEAREFTRGVCFFVAAGTALRRGELVGLRWSRVNLATRELVVDTASVMGGQLKGTKTGGKGPPLVMQPVTVTALSLLRARQLEAFDGMRVDPPEDWFVFSTTPPFDRPPPEDSVTAWFRQACKDAGVSGVRLHDLRHWAVSNALAKGVAPTDVQAMSRHLSLKTMLDVYGHAVSDAAQRATGVLELPTLRALEAGRADAPGL